MKKLIFTVVFSLGYLCSYAAMAVDDVKMPKQVQMMEQSININTATEKELTKLPGIGKSKAKAIVDYRTKNGDFKSVDELSKIDGIGKKVAKALQGKVTF